MTPWLARMNMQQVIYRSGKRFHFVVTEAVLRYLLCPPEVMAGEERTGSFRCRR